MLSCVVIMASYNGAVYIREQLQSIINQTVRPDRIIVCDDCSTDNTVVIANQILESSGIEYLVKENDRNKGVNRNFENMFNDINEDIIFFADQDDIWHLNKIEKVLTCFEKNNCSFVFADAYLFDNRRRYKKTLFETLRFNPLYISEEVIDNNEFVSKIICQPVVAGMSMAVKNEGIQKVLPLSRYIMYDEWISWNYSADRIGVIKECLVDYRQHNNNVVAGKKRKRLGYLIKRSKLNRDEIMICLRKWEEIDLLDHRNSVLSIENRISFEKKKDMLLKRLELFDHGGSFLHLIKEIVSMYKQYDKKYYNIHFRIKDIVYLCLNRFV